MKRVPSVGLSLMGYTKSRILKKIRLQQNLKFEFRVTSCILIEIEKGPNEVN